MRVCLKQGEGPNKILLDIMKSSGNISRLSHSWVEIRTNAHEVFFYPTDYSVVGFSISIHELEELLAEAKGETR